MPRHVDEQHFDYTTLQLFDLVADVEAYPQFLPWVKAVRIVERQSNFFIADVVVHFKHITEQYRCRVDCVIPASDNEAGSIAVSLVSGPFHHLMNDWKFVPQGQGCLVHFEIDFAFKNKLLDRIIGVLFAKATARMVGAFKARAEALYLRKEFSQI